MSKAWSGGSTRAWRKIRLLALERDYYTCMIRTPGICTTEATHVDHIHGKDQCNGCAADELTHLQASCAPCNLEKGKPDLSNEIGGIPHSHWR